MTTRSIVTFQGTHYATPLFLPVYQPGKSFVSPQELSNTFGMRGVIVNAYLLYKNRELRKTVLDQGLGNFLGFDGLIVTDSGAFQQFSGPLYLKNSTIVKFQQNAGADIIAPLDVITSPGENKKNASKKLLATQKRIKEAVSLVNRCILTGAQQGGRFLDLRAKALHEFVEMDLQYVALGSLVPFFNKNHQIKFILQVIKQARQILPENIPIHLYGAGDPVELPFYIAFGCDVFDSSSYIHYSRGGWYMTPFGALQQQEQIEQYGFECPCPYCDLGNIWKKPEALARHNLWTIQNTLVHASQMIKNGELDHYLEHVLEIHQSWFPDSKLMVAYKAVKEA